MSTSIATGTISSKPPEAAAKQDPQAAAAAVADPSATEIVPGADTLGRGIYIRPQQAYELHGHVIKRATGVDQVRSVANGKKPYLIPAGCVVNDSPPLPAGRAVGQTLIEESWYRFGREVSTNIHAAANAKVVTVDATAFQGSTLRIEEDSYYALRSSFVPFWNVYLPKVRQENISNELGEQFKALPDGPYNPLCRAEYARFFDRFGTHFVTSAWLGGKASLTFVVTKSSNVSKEDLKVGIEASFAGGAASGKGSTELSKAQSRVRNNSTCSVFGSGGDATELAKLTTLQPEQYDKWITSIKENPAIIELGVVGIWTLLSDPVKSEALRQAYIEESTFSPLTALVPFRDWMVILKGERAFDYALTSKYGKSRLYTLSCLFKAEEILDPEALQRGLDELKLLLEPGDLRDEIESRLEDAPASRALAQLAGPAAGARQLSEAAAGAVKDPAKSALAGVLNELLLSGASVGDYPRLRKKLEGKFVTWRPQTQEMWKQPTASSVMLNRLLLEELFPKELKRRPAWFTLKSYLPVLEDDALAHFDRPHAALSLEGFGGAVSSKLYLFRWRQCLRIDLAAMTVDTGYPRDMGAEWPEVDFDRIDAAVSVAPNRLYFFRGNEYIRYDFDGSKFNFYTHDLIKNRWPGVVFETIDTAAYWGSNKIYFFFEDQYIRYDLAAHRADPGYPKFLTSNYVEDWEIFE